MKRPATLDEPRPSYPPCPRCGGAVVEKFTREGTPFFRDLAEQYRFPRLEQIPALMCVACRTMAAYIERMECVWRDEGPGLTAQLVADAAMGLRERRFIESDASDPIWGGGMQ